MHHADSTGDSPGSRKMAHSSVFSNRRGSNTGSSGSLSNTANANINANVIPTDDNQSSLLSQHTGPAGCSSPGPHHPPHSLNVQSQSLQSAGAQVKKKSGFQITSVLPAQVSASANNSIADDTESYDDMDESHTEDLSSSDILDVSVSRATDHGVPERSSSEETLNSLHGVDTPGVVSPNEPVLHHQLQQGAQQGYMVNGSVHHQGHHQHQHHGHHQEAPHPMAAPAPVATQSGGLHIVQGGVGATPVVPSSGLGSGQIVRPIPVRPVPLEGAAAGMVGQPPATTKGPVSIGQGGALGIVGGGVIPGAGGTGGAQPVPAAVPATSQPAPGNTSAHSQASASASTAATTATATGSTATSTASRFRVVKLDSNSEPYRKGRWTCTEFYEKEPPPSSAPPTSTAESAAAANAANAANAVAVSAAAAAAAATVVPPQSAPESDSTTSGSSSIGSTLGETGIMPGQPVYSHIPAQQQQQAPHPGAQQPMHQEAGMVPTMHPATMPPAGLQTMAHGVGVPATEGQSAPAMRPLQPMTYHVETQPAQGQMGYPATQQPNAGIAHPGVQGQDFAQHQTTGQAHPMAPMPVGAMPGMGAPGGAAGMPGHPTGGQAAVPQAAQTRPLAPQTQPPGGQPQPLQHLAQLLPDPQPPQHAGALPTPAASVAAAMSGQSVPAMPHPTLGLAHPGAALLAGGMGLALAHQGQMPHGGGAYAGSSLLTASQLEDAQRLLFQQSLPRMAAGMEGTIGMDTGALAAAAGAEEDSSSGASVVAIDNKIEQAMDLVKSHLMYAVREEVEVLKEQIKELVERNSQLEQENNLLKNLASPEQLAQFQAQVQTGSPTLVTQPGVLGGPQAPAQSLPPPNQGTGPSA
ncbi:TSC22 domain family protein 1-like isoform X1 [Alosa alosa]|uniref:TSC22 domain family protein 1-like isoform X1 n=2 Tax=Alosa TaxID=34772 RepID=UPI0020152BC2|nr:TSC22 domain family protein 1-like isoform X1 [Alosa alosa]